MSWTAGEDRRMAEWRDEYQRRKGKHRAQAPKPAQAGPSLPSRRLINWIETGDPERGVTEGAMTEECMEREHSECRRITIDGYECGCWCHDDVDEEIPL